MPKISGELIADSPIYRGNMKKTLFSREQKDEKTPVCLPGKAQSPANRLGDAFICGEPQNTPRFDKLLPNLYQRLFGQDQLEAFFREISITCEFMDPRIRDERFYDMRMGIRINRDRMAMEKNANYKMETVFKGTRFQFTLTYPDRFGTPEKQKLAALVHEMKQGRFWFGGGKSKGLGKLKLVVTHSDLDTATTCAATATPSHTIIIPITLACQNPLLVGWPFHAEGRNNMPANWIPNEIKKIEKHKEIVAKICDGTITTVDGYYFSKDEFSTEVYREFKKNHGSKCRRGDVWDQAVFRRSQTKSHANDDNQILFLNWFRCQAQSELSQASHCDFRSLKGKITKSSTAYDRMFMRMLKWATAPATGWELYISGGTLKGAFRVRAERIVGTLLGDDLEWTNDALQGNGSDAINFFFGQQRCSAQVRFGDAYLQTPKELCSLDSIRIDPATAEPLEGAKMDFLYACGSEVKFHTNLYVEYTEPNDPRDQEKYRQDYNLMMGLLFHLLKDFQDGQIHFGGQKTSGMGWVKGEIGKIEVRANQNSTSFAGFGIVTTKTEGAWHYGEVTWDTLSQSEMASTCHQQLRAFLRDAPLNAPPQFNGLTSHRAFGGHCGRFDCTLTVVTPTHVKESGTPTLEQSQGWDFYHMSPPAGHSITTQAELDKANRRYAISSKTLKGMVRQMYATINSGIPLLMQTKDKYGKILEGRQHHEMSCKSADKLFGFVDGETGYMGRVNFSFAEKLPDTGGFAWYPMPYDTGNFTFMTTLTQTQELDAGRISNELRTKFQANRNSLSTNAKIVMLRKERRWLISDGDNRYLLKLGQTNFRVVKLAQRNGIRIFPHCQPQIRSYESLQEAAVPKALIVPCRCVEKGTKFHFTVDFWNLTDHELADLIWCLQLQAGLAHKIGKGKSLGFGSCQIAINAQESWEYDWSARYRGDNLKELGLRRNLNVNVTRNKPDEAQLYQLLQLPGNAPAIPVMATAAGASVAVAAATAGTTVRGTPYSWDAIPDATLRDKLKAYEPQLEPGTRVLYQVTQGGRNNIRGMVIFKIGGQLRQENDWEWDPKEQRNEKEWYLGNLDANDLKNSNYKKINKKAEKIWPVTP